VLLAAVCWVLLSPSLELSKLMSLLQVAIGFLLEGITIRIVNKILLHLHINLLHPSIAGRKTKLKKIY
jgi:zinc transporter, ZIP family